MELWLIALFSTHHRAVRQETSGIIHDNTFQFIFEPGYGRHGNVLETLGNVTTTFTAYNNITANINEARTGIQLRPR